MICQEVNVLGCKLLLIAQSTCTNLSTGDMHQATNLIYSLKTIVLIADLDDFLYVYWSPIESHW